MKKIPLDPEHRAGQKKIRKMLAAGLPLAALMSGLAGCDFFTAKTSGVPPREPEISDEVKPKDASVRGKMILEPVCPAVHVVKAGDTLGSIARQYGTTAGKLKKLNGFPDKEPVQLTAGQKIKLK